MTRAVGAQVGLEPSSIGMRRALCEVLECAAPGARTGGRGLATLAHGRGQTWASKAEGSRWEGVGRARMGWRGARRAGGGLLFPRRDPGVLAQSAGVGGAVCCSPSLETSAERWGEGCGGSWSHRPSPVRLRCLIRGHLMQSGPLPQSFPRSDLRLVNLLRDFQLYFAESPSPSSRSHGFLFRTGSKITLFLSPFPFLWVLWDSCEVSRGGGRSL